MSASKNGRRIARALSRSASSRLATPGEIPRPWLSTKSRADAWRMAERYSREPLSEWMPGNRSAGGAASESGLRTYSSTAESIAESAGLSDPIPVTSTGLPPSILPTEPESAGPAPGPLGAPRLAADDPDARPDVSGAPVSGWPGPLVEPGAGLFVGLLQRIEPGSARGEDGIELAGPPAFNACGANGTER
jgi:hypothetical protein